MARMRAKQGRDAKGKQYLKYYYAEFYDATRHPKQKRVSLHTRDREAGQLAMADLERRYLAGLFDPWSQKYRSEGITAREALERFLKNRSGHCVQTTVDNYRAILKPFVDSLPPGILIHTIETRHLTDYINAKDRTETTRRGYMDRLRIFFGWCREEGITKNDPVPPVKKGKRSRLKSLPKFLSEEEFERLLRCVEADGILKREIADNGRSLIDIFSFAVSTGLRRAELCNLKWSAIDLSNRMITIKNTEDFQTKSGRERAVPLVGIALEIISRKASAQKTEADNFVFKGTKGGRLNGNYLSKRFRQYRRLARLPEQVNFHSLRHTFASWAVQRGMDLYRLKEIMGHADMKTTMVYAHLRPETLMREMEKCFGGSFEPAKDEPTRLTGQLQESKNGKIRLKESTYIQ